MSAKSKDEYSSEIVYLQLLQKIKDLQKSHAQKDDLLAAQSVFIYDSIEKADREALRIDAYIEEVNLLKLQMEREASKSKSKLQKEKQDFERRLEYSERKLEKFQNLSSTELMIKDKTIDKVSDSNE